MKFFFILIFAAWNCAAFDLSNPAFVGASGRSGAAVVETFPVDLFNNFKGDNGATITTNLLAASSQSVFGIGTWTLTQESGATHVIASTNWVKVNCDKSTNFAAVTFNGEVSTLSIAVNFKFEGFDPFSYQDLISVDFSGGAQYAIFNFFGDAVCGHTPNGGSGKTPFFTLESNTVYLATMKARSSGVCQFAIYDASGNLLWSDSLTNNNATGFNRVALGRYDRIAQATTGNFYYANLRVDFHDAVFPLGVDYAATNYTASAELAVSDDFTGTGALSANWGSLCSLPGLARVSDLLETTSDNYKIMSYTNATFHRDQFTSFKIKNWGSGRMFGGRLRETAGDNAYTWHGSSASEAGFARTISGSYSQIKTTSIGFADEDVLTLGIYGPVLYILKNGTFADYVLTSDIPSGGFPGVLMNANGSGTPAQIDDWSGGNIP